MQSAWQPEAAIYYRSSAQRAARSLARPPPARREFFQRFSTLLLGLLREPHPSAEDLDRADQCVFQEIPAVAAGTGALPGQ